MNSSGRSSWEFIQRQIELRQLKVDRDKSNNKEKEKVEKPDQKSHAVNKNRGVHVAGTGTNRCPLKYEENHPEDLSKCIRFLKLKNP